MEASEHTGELDGQPVFWRAAGDLAGAPPLYLHGVPTSGDDWLPFLERTGGLAPDLPGFGRSGKGGQNDYSLDGIAAFVGRFLELVGVERVQLVVHDWGAAALAWAAAEPERVERLIVCDAVPLLPAYRWHRLARAWRTPVVGELAMGSTFAATLRWALRPAFAGPVPDRLVADAMAHFDPGTQRAILRLHRSAPEASLAAAGAGLARIAAPALVVWGALDPWVPPRFAQEYASRLADARVELISGAGHWPWLDRPELVARFERFLADT